MELKRRARYLYLKLIRLKDDPNELALGMAIGVLVGILPIVPFQIIVAVTLALFFKASKITAAAGTWISNPLNWYFVYWWDYKLGCFVLGFSEKNAAISSILAAIKSGQDPLNIAYRIMESGVMIISAFLAGGIIAGLIAALLTYAFSLYFFRNIHKLQRVIKHIKNTD